MLIERPDAQSVTQASDCNRSHKSEMFRNQCYAMCDVSTLRAHGLASCCPLLPQAGARCEGVGWGRDLAGGQGPGRGEKSEAGLGRWYPAHAFPLQDIWTLGKLER